MIKNAENEVLIDTETKNRREVNDKNQQRARDRIIEAIDFTPEELAQIKAKRKKSSERMQAMMQAAKTQNIKSRAAMAVKPRIKIPNKK
jgi:hypothetical protein